MSDRTTSQTPEDRAWRAEQMERSCDIEGMTPLEPQDRKFLADLEASRLTNAERIEAIGEYIQIHVKGRYSAVEIAQAS